VGEALVEVILGMPRLGMLFALGLRGGADKSLHTDLALRSEGSMVSAFGCKHFSDDQLMRTEIPDHNYTNKHCSSSKILGTYIWPMREMAASN